MGDIDWSSPPDRRLPGGNREKEDATFRKWSRVAMVMVPLLVVAAMYGLYVVDGERVRKEVIAEGISATLVNQRKDHCFRRSFKPSKFLSFMRRGMVDHGEFRACVLEGQ